MNNGIKKLLSVLFMVSMTFLFIGGCDSSSSDNGSESDGNGGDEVVQSSCPEPNLDISVCDPSAGPFSTMIDNEFFPLPIGAVATLEGVDDEGTEVTIVITVLDEVEEVAGVTTLIVEEDEFEDGERVETSRNFFAQAPDGTVCYFGEDVNDFEDGVIVGNEGAWRAGENGNVPGIIMPADPMIGDVFSQEGAEGIAEDQAEITGMGETINIEAGTFTDTLLTEDCNPLEEDSLDEKVYVSGIGLAIDEDAELTSYEE